MQNIVRKQVLTRQRLFWIFVGVALLLTAFTFIQSNISAEAPAAAVASVYTPAKPANTITYPVAGLVEAGESITIFAKRSGFVEQISVVEGDVVEAGAALVVAVDPVTRSRLAVQNEAGILNALKAASASVGAAERESATSIGFEQSVALATLGTAASADRTAAAETKLALTLAQVEAVVPQALRFVQDNKPLFTSESMDLYTEVVEAFYKQEPNYLRIGFTTSGEDTALLTRVAEAKSASSSEMLTVAELVGDELGTLIDLYAQSESEFFDRDQLASDAAELAAYSESRTALTELSVGLVTAIDGAAALGSSESSTAVTATSSVALALVNKDTAISLRALTAQIENATGQLSAAELSVLVTELGLGLSEAPFAGMVTEVYVEHGQYVEAGQPLVRLSGSGAQEMKIKLSGAALNVQAGDAFMINNKTVGTVDRVVPVLEAGSATAYVTFTEAQQVGAVVRGELGVTVGAGLYTISRDYVAFDSVGPYVVTKAGEKIYLKIVHDNGAELVVEGERELNEELVPAFGIRL